MKFNRNKLKGCANTKYKPTKSTVPLLFVQRTRDTITDRLVVTTLCYSNYDNRTITSTGDFILQYYAHATRI